MQRLSLEAEVRSRTGKEVARKLRAAGRIPAVLYGRGIDPVALSVEAKAFESALLTAAGTNVLLDLVIRGNGAPRNEIAMVQEIQRDVLRRRIVHVDFHKIHLTEKIHARIPVVLRGEARGVKEGGILEHLLREVEVECLPTALPERFDLDVSDLMVGHSLHVSDLRAPEGVTLLTSPEETIVTIIAPAAGVEEEAAPPAEEAAEPELVGAEKKGPEESEE
ncbi:MAG: 50S ribosomal protein L25/general stress protein Ctc [Armatimonadota bacterium]|nr:50S ribosomal protein L25/general stress protein Ctc [Armatimonadota bacterium]MDR5697030.1 50S ribosomal protein L25/general stress protein Ctc [Armatimonadota bacterium]